MSEFVENKTEEACGCGHDHAEHAHCGHDHENGHAHCHGDDGCGCGHDHNHDKLSLKEALPLMIGAVFFAAGFLTSGTVKTVLFLAAYALAGAEVLYHAATGIVRGKLFDEQVLMSVATIGALALGDAPEAAAVMIFYRVGEWVQSLAVQRSRQRIGEAVELHPDRATVLRDGKPCTVDPAEVAIGETILVKVGERVPLDGQVASGETRIDVSMLTGEPEPVHVKPGDAVQAGSVNTTGAIELTVTKIASESATGRLLRAVEDAAGHKPSMERFITRFSRVYTPSVVAAAALVAVIPPLAGLGSFTMWLHRALIFLVISCPCALVLSIPLTFFAGLAVTSKNSFLCKGADALESMADVKAAVLDKTGTLTMGQFKVQSVHTNLPEGQLLDMAAALEKNSLHPIAFAIAQAAKEALVAENVTELAGKGVTGTVGGKRVLVGNARLMESEGVAAPADAQGVLVAVDGAYAGEIIVGDELRKSAKDAISGLNEVAGTTVILTGDGEKKAVSAAKTVGATEVYFSLTPEDKLKIMRDIRARVGKTLFVGDGINDAPVLAGSDIGVAMGLAGTEMAAEAADALLLTDDLTRIPFALRAAKLTVRTAKENVVIALAIKTAAMVLAALGLAGMWVAVVADVGAAIICVLHALGLFARAK